MLHGSRDSNHSFVYAVPLLLSTDFLHASKTAIRNFSVSCIYYAPLYEGVVLIITFHLIVITNHLLHMQQVIVMCLILAFKIT